MKRPKLWQSPSLHNRFVRNLRSRFPLTFNFFECKKNDSEMCGECGTFDVIVALETCNLWVSSCGSVSINKRNCCVNQPYHMEITVSLSTSPTSFQCNSFTCSVCVCDMSVVVAAILGQMDYSSAKSACIARVGARKAKLSENRQIQPYHSQLQVLLSTDLLSSLTSPHKPWKLARCGRLGQADVEQQSCQE